tara:strand:- start:2383 stop:2577 length:195 start_codon:yes stop_codon:yes gene_type:complete
MDIIDATTNKGDTTMREDTISALESEIICEALQDFRDAMREDVNATNEEIRESVLKELDHYLKY